MAGSMSASFGRGDEIPHDGNPNSPNGIVDGQEFLLFLWLK